MRTRRILMATAAMLMALSGRCDWVLDTFVSDASSIATNIRSAPRGKVIKKLDQGHNYCVRVTDVKNGWWRVLSVENAEEAKEVEIPEESYIHYTVLGLETRNYGGTEMIFHQYPNDASRIVYRFTEELLVRPLDMVDGWIEVETADKKHRGWIGIEYLCSNPLTTCP